MAHKKPRHGVVSLVRIGLGGNVVFHTAHKKSGCSVVFFISTEHSILVHIAWKTDEIDTMTRI